jgi:hypothetical protein
MSKVFNFIAISSTQIHDHKAKPDSPSGCLLHCHLLEKDLTPS